MQGNQIERDEEVRQIAYKIWQEAGCPTGAEMQHWLAAEALWLENHRPENQTKSAKARKPRQSRTVKREL